MTSALEALGRGATVVTATHRLARFLQARYDAGRLADGARAWPAADVLAWDAWIGRLWEQTVLEEGAPDLLSDDEERLLWRQVIQDEGGIGSLDAGPLADLARQAWQLCGDWAIDPATLEAEADSVDCQAFARWTREFQERCSRAGRLDRGRAALALARQPPRGSLTEHCFTGFDPWPLTHARLHAALGLPAQRAVEEHPSGSVYRHACSDAVDEIRSAAAWARSRVEAAANRRVGIVVPDLAARGGEIRRACLDALAPGWQLNPPGGRVLGVSLGRPLARYPVVHGALLLLRAAAGPVEWTGASELLRCRYLRGSDTEGDGRAEADLRLRTRSDDALDPGDLLRLCRPHAPLLAKQLAGIGAGRRLPAMAPSQWAAHAAELLASAGWPGDRPLDSDEFQATVSWHRLLQSLASLDRWYPAIGFGQAVDLLADLAAHRPFEPGGGEAGVQVMGVLEAEGQDFDHLWLCGLTADEWPPAQRPHPLLPLDLQRRLGLPGAGPTQSREAATRRFRRLLASAGEVICSWPRRQGDVSLAMSSLLSGLPDLPPGEGGPDSYRPDRAAVAQSGHCELLEVDPPPPLAVAGRVAGGATLLNQQSACPARAFAEARLGARELPVPETPLSPRVRGNLVHRLLERLYGLPECRRGLGVVAPADLDRLAADLIDRVLDEYLPGRGSPFRQRLRALEATRLVRLVEQLALLDRQRGEFLVQAEWPREASVGPIRLGLRLDRLDTLPDGARLVIDYKTGGFSVAGWRSDRLAECQLPLYAVAEAVEGVAVLQLGLPESRLTGIGDPALAIGGISSPEKFFRRDGYRWADVRDRWRAQLESLAAEFAAGDFRIDPAAPDPALGPFAALTRARELVLLPPGDEP